MAEFKTSAQTGAASKQPLTVSQALGKAKDALEDIFITMVGEVSEVNSKRGYKAVYFTVKDAKATLPCMMWLDRYEKQNLQLAVGQKIRLTGRFSLYAPKGRMNFDVFSIALAGEGDLRQRIEALARKLDAEGLMAPESKRKLRRIYAHVGVVTSPRGDVVHDVMRTMRRRFPETRISVAGVPVEGPQAPAGMINAMETCVRAGCEVILLVRGGGSFEDLMPFNDEALARAIRACPVPVVTGIGHEPDTTIADMVADVRASTPTGAAQAVTPEPSMLMNSFDNCASRMTAALTSKLGAAESRIEHYASRPVFKDPQSMFATDLMTLDLLYDRLVRALPDRVQRDAQALDGYGARLERRGAGLLEAQKQGIAHIEDRMKRQGSELVGVQHAAFVRQRERLERAGASMLAPFDHALALRAGRLHDLSPLAVIARGYAMVSDEDGHVVSSVASVTPGAKIDVTVSDGILTCAVDEVTATPAVE